MRSITNCKVCVIGGAGFLGSHLVDHLIEERQCEVLVLDNLITGQKKFVNERATFRWFDITGSEFELYRLLKHHQIQYLFNYAAEPYIPVSFARPLHVFNINAFAAVKVLHAANEAGVEGILQVSSAEIYGEATGKVTEDEKVVPHSSYGVSKVAVDGFVQVRWREAQVPGIAMRQFNCVGERETHPYVIPEIISQIAGGSEVVRLGNNSFRDFQYAGDAVRMATNLLERGGFGEVYNMGSETGVKIYDLALLLGEIMGKQIRVETDESRRRPWEIWHLQSDNTKLYSVIERRPEVDLRTALERTVRYFRDNGNRWDF
ncbi:MAG: NAD-dependent epimerase/dehydratase family protein [Desulfobulbaceae bacterium]|nr:NAD-dependent epimerase/dehydratase family protein [Desulfobulbaceae bacterium]